MWTGRLLALVAVFFWGATYVWAKTVLTWLPPFSAAMLRYGLGAVVLFLLALWGPSPFASLRHNWRYYLVQGIVGLTVFQALLFWALRVSSAIAVAVVMALTPLLTALAAALILRERLTRRAAFGMVVSVAGAVLAVLGDHPHGIAAMSFGWGAPLTLAASLCMTCYTIVARRNPPVNVSGSGSMAMVLAIGAIFLVPLALTDPPPTWPSSPAPLWAMAGLVLGSTVIGYLTWNESIRRIGVAGPNMLYNFIPLVTIALSWLEGHPPSPAQFIGTALVIGGVTLGLLPRHVGLAARMTRASHRGPTGG